MKIIRRETEFDLLPRGEGGACFTFRYVREREWPAIRRLATAEVAEGVNPAVDAMAAAIVRWSGVAAGGGDPVFDASKLADIIQRRDLNPLVTAFIQEQNLSPDDVGNSDLPASLPPAGSVPNASPVLPAAGAASVAISPPAAK